MNTLDSPERRNTVRKIIEKRPSLKAFYARAYKKYQECLDRCPRSGIALELGSGASFAKLFIPDLVTSDVIAYPEIDHVIDATRMPFEKESLRAIFLLNVFHHIPDVGSFLKESERCLIPGGRIFMVDQYPGWISTPIYKYLHHEPYDAKTLDWHFHSRGPLSDANGALAWIVFERDREIFRKRFPRLTLEKFEPHSPLWYWLAGGLKSWCLLPTWAMPLAERWDRFLMNISREFGSFADIEIVKR